VRIALSSLHRQASCSWRLTVELREGANFSQTVEHRASRIGSVLPFALAAYIVIGAIYGLWMRSGQDFSLPGFVLAVLTMPIMWWLAKAKLQIADQIGSRALRADAVESITCGHLSVLLVVGLLVQLAMPRWWWVDSVTSLAIVCFVVKEGREVWSGDDCCD
jgi:divalent metal cation (Fe/Co/Zn/Cd) transporter